MFSWINKLVLFLTIAILLSGCSFFKGNTTLENYASAGEGWQGILNSDSDADSVSIFYIHGMGATEADFSKTLRNTIGELIDGKWSHETDPHSVELPAAIFRRGEALNCNSQPELCVVTDFGILEHRTFTPSHKGTKIQLYSYFWNNSAAELQKAYRIYCGGNSPSYDECDKEDYGPIINASLRESVVVNGLGDAAFYLGPNGKMLRQGLQAAICQAIHHANKNEYITGNCSASSFRNSDDAESEFDIPKFVNAANLHFIAKSLGSRVLFDTLYPADELDALVNLANCPTVQPVNAGANTFPEVDRCLRYEDDGINPETISTIFPISYQKLTKDVELKNAIAASLSEVYMFANQLPLLGVGRVVIGSQSEIELRDDLYCAMILKSENCDMTPLKQPGEVVLHSEPSGPSFNSGSAASYFNSLNKKLKVVAFRDPGDMLGFQAGMHMSDQSLENVEFYEIRRRNAIPWIVFSSPGKAHADEDRYEDAVELVFCGASNVGAEKMKVVSCLKQ